MDTWWVSFFFFFLFRQESGRNWVYTLEEIISKIEKKDSPNYHEDHNEYNGKNDQQGSHHTQNYGQPML